MEAGAVRSPLILMTVKELRDVLAKADPEAEVIVQDTKGQGLSVKQVHEQNIYNQNIGMFALKYLALSPVTDAELGISEIRDERTVLYEEPTWKS